MLRVILTALGFFSMAAACSEDAAKPLADGSGGGVDKPGASGAGMRADAGEGGQAGAGGTSANAGAGGEADTGGAGEAGGAPPGECNRGKGATISGRVLSPSGELPLGGVAVYVPSTTVDPPPSGAGCFRCDAALGGSPVAVTVTDAEGRFELTQAPVGEAVPLVVQTGKWRRQLTVNVTGCQDNATDEAETRLPKSRREGHLPAMALVSGGEDTLECLLRKLGIAEDEFVVEADAGRVRLFRGKGGIAQLEGAPLPPAEELWSKPEKLGIFDLVLLGSEPDANAAAKPPAALEAMRTYVSAGGRVLAQHFQSYFLSAGAPEVAGVASYVASAALPQPFSVRVDQSSARGQALAASLAAADPNAPAGSLSLAAGQRLVSAVQAPAVRLLHAESPATVQAFSLELPTTGAACGRLTQTDLLTSSGDTIADFPSGCSSVGLTAEERALAYLIFDLGACLP